MSTQKEVNLRPIKKEDNESIARIIRTALEDYGLDKPGTAYYDPQLDNLSDYYNNQDRAEYFVLEKDDQVIGGGGYSAFAQREDVAELEKLYIDEDHRRQGFSGLLIKKIEEAAQKNGYQHLYIETSQVLDAANLVYVHYGYQSRDEALEGSEHEAMDRFFIKKL